MKTLSVITVALNEERNIADCLASVRWANELIVVDSGSTDRTVEIAKRYASSVLTVDWQGYGPTKNYALDQATGEWVLWLDADERVTPELAEEIKAVIAGHDGQEVGYSVARRAYFLGRWIKHCGWYPSRVTRLFRRTQGRFSESKVHERLIVQGMIGELQSDMLHYTDPDLRHYFEKFNRYTSLAAEDMLMGGRRFSFLDLLVRPSFLFVKMYFLRLGFLDGIHGFILCVVSSSYVFVKYAKLWELQRKQ